jgi:hypothetical protein
VKGEWRSVLAWKIGIPESFRLGQCLTSILFHHSKPIEKNTHVVNGVLNMIIKELEGKG